MHLVSSSGGHLALLRALLPVIEEHPRTWVTQQSPHAEALAAKGETVYLLPEYDRHPIRGHFAQNMIRSFRLVRRTRPQIVITTGAGITVPFCLFARLQGARMIFVETMARVTGPSASGKVLSRLADRVIVQWPEAMSAYRRATLCHPALLEVVERDRDGSGEGTFVAVGLHGQPFDRLLELVDRAAGSGLLPTPVVAQTGSCRYRPRHFDATAWMKPTEVDRAVAGAQVVISHAGAGIVSSALRFGRRPMVLPRLVRHGEHYDDHQQQLVEKLADLDLVVALQDEIGEDELRHAATPLPEIDTGQTLSVRDAVSRELDGIVKTLAGWGLSGEDGDEAELENGGEGSAPGMRPVGLGAADADESVRVGTDFS
jgi:UDP-N-acetylglucosamine transferase subunit ALG13